MYQTQNEIVILKPTLGFLSFLSAQVPHMDLPDAVPVNEDHTAYLMKKCDNEEAELDELERNFLHMFNYEIKRRFGREITFNLQASFLDFLCCFKFQKYPIDLLGNL